MQRTEREIHVCEYCGAKFKARKGAKYCSNSCRVLANKARKEVEPVGNMPKEPQNKPIESRTSQVSTIMQPMQPQRVITKEQARAELKDFLIRAGLCVTLSYLFDTSKNRKRKKK